MLRVRTATSDQTKSEATSGNRMKSALELYHERLPMLRSDHRIGERAALRLQCQFDFWIPYATIVNPMLRPTAGSLQDLFKTNDPATQIAAEGQEGCWLLKQHLSANELSFPSYFRLKEFIDDACAQVANGGDIDAISLALNILMELARLELNGPADPEYGRFLRPYNTDDSINLYEPLEALKARHDLIIGDDDSIIDADNAWWDVFRLCDGWRQTFSDQERFETKFPFQGLNRRVNVQIATEPLFKIADPDYFEHLTTLNLLFGWLPRLLARNFGENHHYQQHVRESRRPLEKDSHSQSKEGSGTTPETKLRHD